VSQPYPPQQPPRQHGRRPSFGARGGQRADPQRLIPQPWPDASPRRGEGQPAPGPGYGPSGYGPSGYGPSGAFAPPMPGTPPGRPITRSGARRTFGRMPSARMARTDPSMYDWDRLSPEQQQAVLATIKAANLPRHGGTLLSRTALIVVLVAAVALVTWLLLTR
jgi:hypothetical protein